MFQLVLSTPFEPEKETITLTYRGVPYEVLQNRTHHPGYTSAAIATLMEKGLIYRGVRYNLNPVSSKTNETTVTKQLIYRGAIYEIQAA
jgi:hypothetical protein